MNGDSNAYTLAVVTPLANEEATIGEFLGRVSCQLHVEDRLFCVLDNASNDRTREIVERHAVEDSRIVCVWAPENRCVVDAYFAGYRAALEFGADWILEMDGGLSHCPEEIPGFRHAINQNEFDYIGGCRFENGGSHEGSRSRRLISRAGTIASNLVLGTTLKDMTGGFQCFNKNALELVVERGVNSRAHFFQTEIKYLLRHHRCHEIPITYTSPSASVNRHIILESVKTLAAMAYKARSNAA